MQKILAQLGLAAGVGAALLVARNMAPPLHPSVRPRIARRAPGVAEAMSHLAALNRTPELEAVMDLVDYVLDHMEKPSKASQWRISRANGDIVRRARAMCDSCRAGDGDVFYAVVMLREEHIPRLESHLEALLHNHVLDVS